YILGYTHPADYIQYLDFGYIAVVVGSCLKHSLLVSVAYFDEVVGLGYILGYTHAADYTQYYHLGFDHRENMVLAEVMVQDHYFYIHPSMADIVVAADTVVFHTHLGIVAVVHHYY